MIVLRFQCVTPIVSHQLTRPDDSGVTHGHSGQTDASKPGLQALSPENLLSAFSEDTPHRYLSEPLSTSIVYG